jgi:hypothetical protein
MNTQRTAVACSSGTMDIRRETDGRVRVRFIDWTGKTIDLLLTAGEVDQAITGLAIAIAERVPA